LMADQEHAGLIASGITAAAPLVPSAWMAT
jgi:hypothetical protein